MDINIIHESILKLKTNVPPLTSSFNPLGEEKISFSSSHLYIFRDDTAYTIMKDVEKKVGSSSSAMKSSLEKALIGSVSFFKEGGRGFIQFQTILALLWTQVIFINKSR